MFNLLGFLYPDDGYGYAAIKLAEAMRAQGTKLAVHDWHDDERFIATPVAFEGQTLALTIPEFYEHVTAPRLVAFTMFETTRLPAGWVERINRLADAVLVPTPWVAGVFRENGVTSPLTVARLGVDPAEFPLIERGYRGPFTFLWTGTPDFRKGWDLVYQAFADAFGQRRDVRLILHFREQPFGMRPFRDRNVEVRVGMMTRHEQLAELAEADAYVFPSRGEGFGLPPREAAATGLPVIATDWGGLGDDIEHWAYPLACGLERADYGQWGEVGEWAAPDYDHLVELMRFFVKHREEAEAHGHAASTWLAAHGTWDEGALAVRHIMEQWN